MTTTVKTFADFGVDPLICQALESLGITTPFPIQELTLPLALSGADVIGQARTGTGKTLAFGIPILERISTETNATQALVIVPTRELCLQVHDDLNATGSKTGATVVAAYGGRAIDPQSEAIAGGAEIVVGTPGRLLDLVRRGVLHLSTVTTLVLDEADEMLDMGFLPDVEQLIEACAEERQTLLFSATMPSQVVALARRYMRKPTFMRADVEESHVAPATRQHFFAVHRMDKPAVVARILATPERGRCVIFTRTKRMADMLVKDLREAGLNAAAIHSDLRQEAREKTLSRFRAGKIDVMCATEVAARGLDIDDVTHVINYDCPEDEKMYLHRIGRTGRAGAEGVAVTLAIWNELARLDMIKKALDIGEPTLEVFSTSDVLDDLFPLPVPAQEDHDGDVARESRQPTARGRKARQAAAPAERPASTSADTEDEEPTVVRRRTRSRSRASDAAASGSPGDTGSAPDVSVDESDEATLRRRRVRRRSTRPATTSPPRDGEAPDSQRPVAADAAELGDDSQQTPATEPEPTPARSSSNRSGRQPGRRTRANQRPKGSRRGRSGRGGRRGQRDAGGRRPADHRADPADASSSVAAAAQAPLDAKAARGPGKPGLRRPLRIAHLP